MEIVPRSLPELFKQLGDQNNNQKQKQFYTSVYDLIVLLWSDYDLTYSDFCSYLSYEGRLAIYCSQELFKQLGDQNNKQKHSKTWDQILREK